jgi:hypothetical protein
LSISKSFVYDLCGRLSVDASDLAPFASSAGGKERAKHLEVLNLLDSGSDGTFGEKALRVGHEVSAEITGD